MLRQYRLEVINRLRTMQTRHFCRYLWPAGKTIFEINSSVNPSTPIPMGGLGASSCSKSQKNQLYRMLYNGPQLLNIFTYRWGGPTPNPKDRCSQFVSVINAGDAGARPDQSTSQSGPTSGDGTTIAVIPNAKVWKLVDTRRNPNGYKGNFNESTKEWKKVEEYSATGSGLRFTFSWTDTRWQAVRVKDIVFDYKVKNLPKKITAGKPVKFTLEGVADNRVNKPYAETRFAEIRVRHAEDPNANFRKGLKLGPGPARKGKTSVSVPVEFTLPNSTPSQFEIHFYIWKTAAYVVWVYRSQL